MDHVAIMKKSWGMIPKILSGEKTIESRWYQTKRAPWDTAFSGDTIFFKDSGGLVTAQAIISKVMQLNIGDVADIQKILKKYNKKICLPDADPKTWNTMPRYCILLWLTDPKPIAKPFSIDKTGFGAPAAWITVKNIRKIKIDSPRQNNS